VLISQAVQGIVGHYFAFANDDHLVANGLYLLHNVRAEDNGFCLPQVADQLPDAN
jgi:hypothetical protein